MQAMHGRLSQPIHYQALQHFVTHSPWPDQPLWDRVNDVIPERRGVLAIDDTGLPKQGKHSVGVKRQYRARWARRAIARSRYRVC